MNRHCTSWHDPPDWREMGRIAATWIAAVVGVALACGFCGSCSAMRAPGAATRLHLTVCDPSGATTDVLSGPDLHSLRVEEILSWYVRDPILGHPCSIRDVDGIILWVAVSATTNDSLRCAMVLPHTARRWGNASVQAWTMEAYGHLVRAGFEPRVILYVDGWGPYQMALRVGNQCYLYEPREDHSLSPLTVSCDDLDARIVATSDGQWRPDNV